MPGGYVVRDANDQALAYVYSRANEAEAMQAKVLTDDEARETGLQNVPVAVFGIYCAASKMNCRTSASAPNPLRSSWPPAG
jgi:hypothetical protein